MEDLFGTNQDVPIDDRVCLAAAKVRKEIQRSAMPALPLFWTEWNVPGMKEARDTSYVGPALANTVRECDGFVEILSSGPSLTFLRKEVPLRSHSKATFGLRAKGGINKPIYAFSLLHRLGDQRLANAASNMLVTRRSDGALLLAVWNLVDPDKSGSPLNLRLTFEHIKSNASASVTLVDDDHGNTLAAYRSLGSPRYPTPEQVGKMNALTAINAPDHLHLDGDHPTFN